MNRTTKTDLVNPLDSDTCSPVCKSGSSSDVCNFRVVTSSNSSQDSQEHETLAVVITRLEARVAQFFDAPEIGTEANATRFLHEFYKSLENALHNRNALHDVFESRFDEGKQFQLHDKKFKLHERVRILAPGQMTAFAPVFVKSLRRTCVGHGFTDEDFRQLELHLQGGRHFGVSRCSLTSSADDSRIQKHLLYHSRLPSGGHIVAFMYFEQLGSLPAFSALGRDEVEAWMESQLLQALHSSLSTQDIHTPQLKLFDRQNNGSSVKSQVAAIQNRGNRLMEQKSRIICQPASIQNRGNLVSIQNRGNPPMELKSRVPCQPSLVSRRSLICVGDMRRGQQITAISSKIKTRGVKM